MGTQGMMSLIRIIWCQLWHIVPFRSTYRLRILIKIWVMRPDLRLETLSAKSCEDNAGRAHIVAANIAKEVQTRILVHSRGDPRSARSPQLPSIAFVLHLCTFVRRATRKCAW